MDLTFIFKQYGTGFCHTHSDPSLQPGALRGPRGPESRRCAGTGWPGALRDRPSRLGSPRPRRVPGGDSTVTRAPLGCTGEVCIWTDSSRSFEIAERAPRGHAGRPRRTGSSGVGPRVAAGSPLARDYLPGGQLTSPAPQRSSASCVSSPRKRPGARRPGRPAPRGRGRAAGPRRRAGPYESAFARKKLSRSHPEYMILKLSCMEVTSKLKSKNESGIQ
ncbi:PREDICTED: collagen alpha-1(VIII) chain-like [Chinchilla lanigera]|uniref:collagen alpha-1(VIII) chain-like n=1 Tax=Chinchilla lanigera TaxID=34839 RepID=UPI000696308F|nr:PREDICTED: collagen alpha-1(VIII) chain-like [Chinchilla lanigera]